jgi:hypothetical protein
VSDLHSIPLDEHMCSPGGFAPHIPVLYREVPFILNITPSALCVNHKAMVSKRTNTLMAEAGTGIVLPGPSEAGRRGCGYWVVLVPCPGKKLSAPAPPLLS